MGIAVAFDTGGAALRSVTMTGYVLPRASTQYLTVRSPPTRRSLVGDQSIPHSEKPVLREGWTQSPPTVASSVPATLYTRTAQQLLREVVV